jgi:hypothetical protein
VISKWVTNNTAGRNWHPAAHFAVATISGGTMSVITGGKFATGAQTAAFGYLFNWLMTVHISISNDALRTEVPKDQLSSYALDVALVDKRPTWDISQDPSNAVWHGMCTGGDSAATCDVKKTDYLTAQWEAKSRQGFARLAHAIQDFEAPMHGGKSYYGFTTASEAAIHFMSDLRPPPAEYERLVQRTRQLFRDYNAYCNGCLKR